MFISTVPKYLLRGDEASELSAQGEADGKIKLCKVMEKRIPWRGHLGMCGNHWDRDEQGIVVPAWSLCLVFCWFVLVLVLKSHLLPAALRLFEDVEYFLAMLLKI